MSKLWLPPSYNGTNGTTHKAEGADTTEAWAARLEDMLDAAESRGYRMQESKDYIGDIIATQARSSAVKPDADLYSLEAMYSTSLFVYACVYALSTSLAGIPIAIESRQPDGSWEDDPDSELAAFWEEQYGAELIQMFTMYAALTGTAYMVGERNGGTVDDPRGEFTDLRVLRTSRISVKPGAGGEYGVEWFIHSVAGRDTFLHPLNVARFKYGHPTNDYFGHSPVLPILRTLKMDEQIEVFNATTLESGGSPDAALSTDQMVGEAAARRMERRWKERFAKGRSGGVVVLDRGLDVKPLGFSPKDMEFESMSKITESRILAAFGVPPMMVMDLRDASVLANADVQRRMFYEVTLMPLARRLEQSINRTLQNDLRFFERQRVRFDWDKVDVLREDDADIQARARENYDAGGITLNEYRAVLGLDPVDGGDEFKKAPAPILPPSFGGGGKPPPEEEDEDEEPDDEEKRYRPGKHAISAEVKRMARARHKDHRDRFVGKAASAMRSFFKEQSKRIKEKARAYFDGKGKAHRTGPLDDLLFDALWDDEFELEELRAKLGPIYLDSMVVSGKSTIAALLEEVRSDGPLSISADHERILAAFEAWGAEKVVDINDATKASLKDILADAYSEGYNHSKTIEEIGSLFGQYVTGAEGKQSRAERIADTEINQALNTGSFEAAQAVQDLGGEIHKSWLSARDERVRDSHQLNDDITSAKPIPLDQPFPNDLMYPNDPSGPGYEVINCRCSMIEVLAKEPEQ